MNVWLITSLILLVTLIPVTIATMRKNALDRLIGMSLGGIIATFCLIAISVGTGRTIYIDVAMVVAFLSFAGAVAFSRFLERWL